MPLVGQTFGKVLRIDVLEHIINRRQLLQECHRILKPQGKLLLTAPNRDTTWKRTLRRFDLPSFADPDHKIEYTPEELEGELTACGFKMGPRHSIVYDTPFAGFLDVLGACSISVYCKIQRWKIQRAMRYPLESTGWWLVAEKEYPR